MLLGDEKLREWEAYLAATQRAFDEIRAGRLRMSPGEFVVRQQALPEWARGFVWDTEDASDCKPVQRSTRDTVFPGEGCCHAGAGAHER